MEKTSEPCRGRTGDPLLKRQFVSPSPPTPSHTQQWVSGA